MVFPVEVTGHFAAQESPGDRMIRISAQSRPAAVLIDVDQKRAGVWAIECADRVADLSGGHTQSITFVHVLAAGYVKVR